MVRAIMIVEMMGKPATHLTESLEKHVGILYKINDINVHSIKVSEPVEIKQKSDNGAMFTAFAECDFETESFARITEIMFDFMPSSVEVIEPSKVTMDTNESTALLNNISGRMHRYDEFAKVANVQLQQMNSQLQAAQKILIEKDKEIEKLKKRTKKDIKKKAPIRKNIRKNAKK